MESHSYLQLEDVRNSFLDTESQNIPMAKVAARVLTDNKIQLGFSEVPAGATITVYDKADSQPNRYLKQQLEGIWRQNH